jgi:hypothetical protein
LPAGYAKDFEDIFEVFPGLIYERIINLYLTDLSVFRLLLLNFSATAL